MADYNPLPAPQFSYTKQLEAYDELLRKRKNKQKWGNILNHADALMNPNHVASGTFAQNEKRIASSYGSSLAQESKRLSLLGKAEKEGIHQEISRRLQDATKKYSMASKSEFDAWFETLGPHFAGEYKKYFDEWNAGVKVKRLEVEDLRKEARFGWDRLKQDQDQSDRAATKVKEADVAFKDAEIDKLFLANVNAYSNYNNQLQMGIASGGSNITNLRMDIYNQVQAQDWSNDVKDAVIYGAWDRLNKGVTGSSVVPTASVAFSVDEAKRKQGVANTTRLQKTANRKAKTAYAAFVADNKPETLEQYVDYHRQLSDQLDAINYAGIYAGDSDTKALMDKFEKRYKGWEAQRPKRYDPEKIPTTKKAQHKTSGIIRYVTEEQMNATKSEENPFGDWIPEESKTQEGVVAWPKKHFIVANALMMDEKDPAMKNRILAYLKTMQEKGIVYVATEEEAEIANKIEKRLEVIDESGLAALAKVLGLGNADRGTAITGGDSGSSDITEAPQEAIDVLLRDNTEEARKEFMAIFGYIPAAALP